MNSALPFIALGFLGAILQLLQHNCIIPPSYNPAPTHTRLSRDLYVCFCVQILFQLASDFTMHFVSLEETFIYSSVYTHNGLAAGSVYHNDKTLKYRNEDHCSYAHFKSPFMCHDMISLFCFLAKGFRKVVVQRKWWREDKLRGEDSKGPSTKGAGGREECWWCVYRSLNQCESGFWRGERGVFIDTIGDRCISDRHNDAGSMGGGNLGIGTG